MTDISRISLKGHFLIAMPGMADPNFAGPVVCICEHSASGCVGLIINSVYPSLFGRHIFDELQIDYTPNTGEIPIHFGGPVHMDEIFILHGQPLKWDASLEITPNLAMSNTRDVLEAIAIGKGPEAFIITLGCSGWSPNQVEMELKENVWLSHPLSEKIIFHSPVEKKWEEAMRKIGIDPALLSDTAGHA